MSRLQPVRGTHDILPEEMRRHRMVTDTAREAAGLYGFQEIATPIFEFTEVFQRTLGDTSDIVTKEMYTFTDRSGDFITLRPENTAGVARAVVSGGLTQQAPLKFFYYGPMFRHERPQKGRLRQFHQIGVELMGIEGPQADVEVIACGARILDRLGVRAKTVLEINSLGTPADRLAYRERLKDFLGAHLDRLSEDSRARLERNPLRILDSKDEADRRVIAGAPALGESFGEDSRAFFDEVRRQLDALGIAYVLNDRLVRGLDYYTHTAFEFTTDALGAQSAVLAGGRYDGLIQEMGGPAVPGVGWAAGVERLAMLLGSTPAASRPIAIVPVGDAARLQSLRLAEDLRAAGFHVELGYSGNLSRRMKAANKAQARAAVILGEDELARGAATLRDLDSGEQAEVPLAALKDRLAAFR